jgi:hypothetical protein
MIFAGCMDGLGHVESFRRDKYALLTAGLSG